MMNCCDCDDGGLHLGDATCLFVAVGKVGVNGPLKFSGVAKAPGRFPCH